MRPFGRRRDGLAVSPAGGPEERAHGPGGADRLTRCDNRHLRILHAIHDFLPRHQAGSELYAFELCRAIAACHHVSILCAEYDASRQHGHVTWRAHQGLPVIEIVNNWVCASFRETYRPPLVGDRIAQVLRAVQPDVVHIHNLLNLSFDLPALAHAHGIPVVATLHDYALVCPSGGQRIHRADRHLCDEIDAARCVRCFRDSPFHQQIAFGRVAAVTRASGPLRGAAVAMARRFPRLAGRIARTSRLLPLTKEDIDDRLSAARAVFEEVDLFVAPSPSIAAEFQRLGVSASRIRVSDYGFVPLRRNPGNRRHETPEFHGPPKPLRIGYVGTLAWHKGVHVLLEAVRGLAESAYELKIFGSVDTFAGYTADLRSRAAGLPVRFMGAFDHGRAADVYAQIDVLVVPSLWLENSPLVIHEALMAGVPVVGARIGGIAGLVEDRRTGLLYDPVSPAELEATLRSLIENPKRLDDLAAHAAALPRAKSIAEDARAWEATYADVLRRRPAAGSAT